MNTKTFITRRPIASRTIMQVCDPSTRHDQVHVLAVGVTHRDEMLHAMEGVDPAAARSLRAAIKTADRLGNYEQMIVDLLGAGVYAMRSVGATTVAALRDSVVVPVAVFEWDEAAGHRVLRRLG